MARLAAGRTSRDPACPASQEFQLNAVRPRNAEMQSGQAKASQRSGGKRDAAATWWKITLLHYLILVSSKFTSRSDCRKVLLNLVDQQYRPQRSVLLISDMCLCACGDKCKFCKHLVSGSCAAGSSSLLMRAGHLLFYTPFMESP